MLRSEFMTEIYELPQGRIVVCYSDESLSVGLLELNPMQELPKHNRPVEEELVQISGSSVMKIIEKDKSVELKENDRLLIPANQFHIHANESDKKSITMWKFKGNIAEVIDNIRQNYIKIL